MHLRDALTLSGPICILAATFEKLRQLVLWSSPGKTPFGSKARLPFFIISVAERGGSDHGSLSADGAMDLRWRLGLSRTTRLIPGLPRKRPSQSGKSRTFGTSASNWLLETRTSVSAMRGRGNHCQEIALMSILLSSRWVISWVILERTCSDFKTYGVRNASSPTIARTEIKILAKRAFFIYDFKW